MSDAFQTISKPTESLFKDRGSKFLGYAFPVNSVDDVKKNLTGLQELHPSARHFCYAYLLGADASEYRANDDGEPNGSAGLPILNQIKSKEVTYILVVVVRYFGGTKLGVSGLVNAYKEAAKLALEGARIITKVPSSRITIRFPHSATGEVERIIRQNNYVIQTQDFGMDCLWTVEFATSEKSLVTEQFQSLADLEIVS